MKIRLLFCLAISAVAFLRVHAEETAVRTDADIKREVIATYNAAVVAAESMNVDALAAFLTDNDDGALVINGRIFQSRTQAVDITRKNFSRLRSVKYDVGPRLVKVISHDTALLVTSGSVSVQTEEGQLIAREFAQSVLYVRQNGLWRVLHSHLSNPK